METICQSCGASPPFPGSVAEGLRSPSLTCLREPIIPSLSLNKSSFSVLQHKSPRIPVFDRTMVEKIHGQKLRSKELARAKKFMNVVAVPVVPESTTDFTVGGYKNIVRYSVPKLKTTPFHYPFQYPHLESWRQIARFRSRNYNGPTVQKQAKQQGLLGFPAVGHEESNHRKLNCQSMTIKKNLPLKDDLPSSTLLKPKFFDGDTAIMRKPGKLWKNKSLIKQKLLGKIKGKRTQRKSNILHKTELCVNWALTFACKFGDNCNFAHGVDELKNRVRPSNYKTGPCADCALKNRKCLYGQRCNFGHPGEAIRRNVGSAYFDREYYKDLQVNFKDNEYPFGIFV
jgi:hypothetical protein